MHHVFLDDLILYNLLMNGLLLVVTAYFARAKMHWLRIFLGSLLGSLYLITFFVPGLHLLTGVFVRWLCPLPMIWLAFPAQSGREFARLVGLFYLIAMGAGGVTLGSYFLAQNNPWWSRGIVLLHQVPSWLPVAGLIITFLIVRGMVEQLRTLWRRSEKEFMVKISLNGNSVTVKALLDTGNELKDPISGRSVMVVEQQQLAPLFTSGVDCHFADQTALELAEILGSTPWADRIRLLPFRSVGKADGILLALRPDTVQIETVNGRVTVPDLLVAFGHRIAPGRQAYQALLPAAVSDRLPTLSDMPTRVTSL